MDNLVPGRECGDCQACCIVPSIDNPDIQKKSGSRCRHCTVSPKPACAIYDTRPQVCRDYFCGWRRTPLIPDDWRPDKSGVFVDLDVIDAPPLFRRARAVTLVLIGNRLKTVREAWFINFVAVAMQRNFPVSLSVPGPEGYMPTKMLLNTKEMRAAAGRSAGRVKVLLEKYLKMLTDHEFLPQVIANSGNDAST